MCIAGRKKGQLRGVKEVVKHGQDVSQIDYNRELEAMAKFSNEKYVHCFVEFFGWFESERAVHIAMEYLEHGSLDRYMTTAFPEPEVQNIGSQLSEGIYFLHENGFAHRDLKPGNILVFTPRPNWWVKIGDFGISKRIEESSTALRTLIGTKNFAAPELLGIFTLQDLQLQNTDLDTPYTSKVDIWSLGVIVFQLMTRELPFRTHGSLASYVTLGSPLPEQPLANVNASTDCKDFLKRAMAPSASQRPSAKEVSSFPWLSPRTLNTENDARSPPDDAALPQVQAGNVLEDQVDFPDASASWTSTTLTPRESAQDIRSMIKRADALVRQDKFKEADVLLQEVVALSQEVLGPEHGETLRCMYKLAITLSRRDKYKEAELMVRRTVKLMTKALGPEHPETLRGVHHLGLTLLNRRKDKEAEATIQEAFELTRKALGPEHPDTLDIMESLAYVLSHQGRHTEAEDMIRETVKLARKVHGPSNAATLAYVDTLKSMTMTSREPGRIIQKLVDRGRRFLF